MALKRLETLERDLLSPFSTHRDPVTIVNSQPSFADQINNFANRIDLALSRLSEKLQIVAGRRGVSMQLSKWQEYHKEARKCELCANCEEMPLFDIHPRGVNMDYFLMFARLASSELCKKHSPEFDSQLKTGWSEASYSITSMLFSLDCDIHIPWDLGRVPYYVPDTLLEWEVKNLIPNGVGTDAFPLLCDSLTQRNDLLGRTRLHQFLDLGGQNCEAVLLDVIRKGPRLPSAYNQLDCLGRTPLHIACLKGHALLAHELLKRGANPSLKTKKGFCALHFAGAKGFFNICQMVGRPFNLRGPDVRSAKDYALKNYHFRVAKLLTTARDDDDGLGILPPMTSYPLIRAVMLRSAAEVRDALNRGANPNIFIDVSFSGGLRTESALTIALDPDWGTIAPDGSYIADILLEFRASIEAKSDRGETALHICARKYNMAGTHWLLGHGADLLAQNRSGCTALMLAVKKGWRSMWSIILEHARSRSILLELLHATDNKGHTARDYAGWYRRTTFVEWLGKEEARCSNGSSTIQSQSAT